MSIGKTIQLPVTTETFTATAADGDGSIASYLWTQTSGPTCTLSGEATNVLTITAATTAGAYVFHLVVTDNAGGVATADVTLTVLAAVAYTTWAEIENLDEDQVQETVVAPANTASLYLVSHLQSGDAVVSYAWEQYSGPTCTLGAVDTVQLDITDMDTIGIYVFNCTVTTTLGIFRAVGSVEVIPDITQYVPGPAGVLRARITVAPVLRARVSR